MLPVFLLVSALFASESLLQENEKIEASSRAVQQLYALPPDQKFKDITQDVLQFPDTSPEAKHSIETYKRRIILFQYPSDNLSIKGFLSYTPNPETHPLLILFRWGNRDFALMNPGVSLATYEDYTVLSSSLRGGINKGTDEFGGKDINDMTHLLDFLPTLAEELGIKLHPHCTFMLGPSRGGLEMFITLAKNPKIQDKVDKIVALSSILDLHQQIHDRPDDMKPMFQNDFGLNPANPDRWIKSRDPLENIDKIKKTLPILIIQGTADPRVNLSEGKTMVHALKETGHDVEYWEIPGGDHTLSNYPSLMDSIDRWFEKNMSCDVDQRKYLQTKPKS